MTTCCFCGEQIESLSEALDQEWSFGFWKDGVAHVGMTCPKCQATYLVATKTGGVLKPEYRVPPKAVPENEMDALFLAGTNKRTSDRNSAWGRSSPRLLPWKPSRRAGRLRSSSWIATLRRTGERSMTATKRSTINRCIRRADCVCLQNALALGFGSSARRIGTARRFCYRASIERMLPHAVRRAEAHLLCRASLGRLFPLELSSFVQIKFRKVLSGN